MLREMAQRRDLEEGHRTEVQVIRIWHLLVRHDHLMDDKVGIHLQVFGHLFQSAIELSLFDDRICIQRAND